MTSKDALEVITEARYLVDADVWIVLAQLPAKHRLFPFLHLQLQDTVEVLEFALDIFTYDAFPAGLFIW